MLYFVVSESISAYLLVTRDLVIAVYRARGKWNSRDVAAGLAELGPAFIKRMNLHKEPLNLQGGGGGWNNGRGK